MLRLICGAVPALLLVLCAPLAAASKQRDVSACMDGSGKAAIAGCTLLIKSGHLEGKALAAAYKHRAQAEMDRNDNDAAIADYSRALRLVPGDTDACSGRGSAEVAKDDYKDAAADFSRVLKREPDDMHALLGRGMSLALLNHLDAALKDFSRAIALHPDSEAAYFGRAAARRDSGDLDGMLADDDKAISIGKEGLPTLWFEGGVGRYLKGDAKGADDYFARSGPGAEGPGYVAIWRYLAATRAGQNGKPALAAFAAKGGHDWPQPIIAFLLGRETQGAMLRTAARSGPDRKGNECDASYYLAEWYLLRDDKAHALPLLHKAMGLCVRESDEYAEAHVRLLQLGK